MKRLITAVITVLLLVGCGDSEKNLDHVLEFRRQLLGAQSEFTADITADYGDVIYTFSIDCAADKEGNLSFTVTRPETIAGITGILSGDGGKLTFDGKALAFPMLAEGKLTPVSAPYVFLKTLRGGYIHATGQDGDNMKLIVDDSYEEDSVRLEIWLNQQMQPVQAEIFWRGRRAMSMTVRNFRIL